MTIARREFLAGVAALGMTNGVRSGHAPAQTPPRRFTEPVIDAHTHWFPPAFADLLEREGPANGATVSRTPSGELNVKVPGAQYYSPGGTTFRADMMDPATMIKAADDRGVDLSVLTQTNPNVIWAPPAFGLKLARAINDGTAAIHEKFPTRFLGGITLPMQDPALALEELARSAKLPGMRAVGVTENVRDRNLHEKVFWPVWERCEALGLPVFLHNVNPIHERLVENDFSMMNVLGNPFEATIAATALVLGGVMDAFPKLEVYLPHAGGFFPFAVARMDFAASLGQFKNLKQAPSAYLRRFYYDIITHSPALTRTLIDIVGIDRIVSGTDFPQPMAIARPVDYVERIPGITAREAQQILCGNPAKLLRL
jgi:aminocarboxymuconate-semialdehyde decarboxylase